MKKRKIMMSPPIQSPDNSIGTSDKSEKNNRMWRKIQYVGENDQQ